MPSATDKLLLATVTAVSGTELTCTPDGSVGSVTAVDCCGAQVADRVVLEWHYTQLLAIAIVGGPHGAADRIVETGTSNGWAYTQYASGRITATRNYNVSCASTGRFVATLTLPKTMADTTYIVLTQVPNWCIDSCRFNSFDRTTTTVPLVYHVEYSDASTIDFMCYLDGTVA